jgi:hypothetical protein
MFELIAAAALLAAPAAPAAAPAQAAAQPVMGAPAASGGKWVAHWGSDSCWLLRGAEMPSGAIFAIGRRPASEVLTIRFVEPGWSKSPAAPGEELGFVLDAGREPLAGKSEFVPDRVYLGSTPLDRAHVLFASPDGALWARLAAATSLSVLAGGHEVARTRLPAMAKAMEALRSCEEDALAAWGVDVAGLAALRSRPLPAIDPASLLKSDDYPTELVRQNVSGAATMRIRVDETGKPVACVVVATSGNELLDRKSCSLTMERARYFPAVDAAGRNVAADFVTTYRWLLPGS